MTAALSPREELLRLAHVARRFPNSTVDADDLCDHLDRDTRATRFAALVEAVAAMVAAEHPMDPVPYALAQVRVFAALDALTEEPLR